MPLYEYECQSCAKRFELIRKFSDPPLEVCPTCGGKVTKLLSSPAIQFKGSGFYITDYARKSEGSDKSGEKASKRASEKSDGASDKAEKTSDAGSSESKSSESKSSESKTSGESKPAASDQSSKSSDSSKPPAKPSSGSNS
jgi:putative FmdB family regulatory protein